jgi:CheY-like chemotaxis protein
MRPAAGVPAQSPDWRAYRILELRYIEGLSPNEVMNRLALGKSQYFRDQARVLDALTRVLWEQWQRTRATATPATEVSGAAPGELVHAETERLCAQATWEAVDVAEVLDDLRAVMDPLARAQDAAVYFTPMQRLTILHADRVMLRQAILTIVTHALDVARGGRVGVSGFAQSGETGICVVARGSGPAVPPAGDAQEQEVGLEICCQLMAAMRGTLCLGITECGDWEARLAWPVAEPCVLLVVDDNAAFVDLFRRYLAGYNWQVVGATTGAEARQIIAEARPTVIALDVMMPREDGWEFLMALKAGADTRDVPVVVCSVLNEPQLALTLGAAAYLAKPVAQQALLRALAPWSRSGASLGPAR